MNQAGPQAFAIVNTRSGNHDEETIADALSSALEPAGIGWKWHLRTKGQSRRDLTREALENGADIIVAVGGDGTVSRCADVVAEFPGRHLGILPTGTGNLLATELGVPTDVSDAAAAIATGHTRDVDGMHVNGQRRCFSHVSMGTYSRIAEMDTPEDKQKFGRLAYVKYLAEEVGQHRSWEFELVVDGATHSFEASLVLVANVGGVGLPGLRWGAGIAPDDGILDLCVVTARTPSEYLELGAAVLARRFESTDQILHLSARHHIRIETDPDLPLRGDGAEIGSGTASIDVVPAAVEVLVPAG